MYVQVRLVTSSVEPLSFQINCRSVNELIEELKDKVAEEFASASGGDSSRVRLFFDGKELQNGHSLFDYSIKINDVIQALIRPESLAINEINENHKTCKTCENSDSNSNENQQNLNEDEYEQNLIEEEYEQNLNEDEYYKIGDHIDAVHTDTGAWFEATIVRITTKGLNKHFYHVKYDKLSLNSSNPIPLKLCQIRPQSSRKLSLKELNVNDIVLVNVNRDTEKSIGYWYECRVEKKLIREKKLIGTVLINQKISDDCIEMKSQRIWNINEIYAIQVNVKRKERSPDDDVMIQFGTKYRRETPPDCSNCNDIASERCKVCSCHECGGKNAPEKQIICDECDAIYHIWCLIIPLREVPCEDWYCDKCKNTDHNTIAMSEEKRLEMRKKSLNRVGVKEWGRGMACMGRTKICQVVGKDHFGPIPGVEVGTWWRFRVQASEAGVHTPLVAGIHGKESLGAYSIVFSCSYDDDIDLGNDFYYTASGGRDSVNKCRVGGPQVKDQELKRCNKALAVNCYAKLNEVSGADAGGEWRKGKPVRVLRSGNARGAVKKSPYLPKIGVRYDGIYKVVKYFPQKGESGFLIWRYLLRRDDPTPPPWSKEGKTRIRRLGLSLICPEGYAKDTASKRSWKAQENALGMKKLKVNPFVIPGDVCELIKMDTENAELWNNLMNHAKSGKMEFYRKFEEYLKCICCFDTVQNPVTTFCHHNICKLCLERSFNSGINNCPLCRTSLKKNKRKLTVNLILKEIIYKLIS